MESAAPVPRSKVSYDGISAVLEELHVLGSKWPSAIEQV
jgi:hypothetical protein